MSEQILNGTSAHYRPFSVSEINPESFLRQMQHHGMLQCRNDDGLSGRGLMTSLGEGKDRSFNDIILLNDLSFPSPALATAQIAAHYCILLHDLSFPSPALATAQIAAHYCILLNDLSFPSPALTTAQIAAHYCILLNDLSFPSPALTTAQIAALRVIGMLASNRVSNYFVAFLLVVHAGTAY